MADRPAVTVVVPTLGRPSLTALLDALGAEPDPPPVLLVDDRRAPDRPLLAGPGRPGVSVLPGRGAGPASARNVGWRAADTEWVAFLDDDVVPPPGWSGALLADLARCPPEVAASQGRIVVPLPAGRRPTDWERNVAGLAAARWATADMAYRRRVLAAVGGFDERFPRAYREDADLGLRVVGTGARIERGERYVRHPVRPAPWWVSVALQRGNADDALMRRLHGPGWRERAGVPAGRRPRHLLTTAAATVGLAGGVTGRRVVAAAGAAGYLLGVGELTWRRVAPGPRTVPEAAAMVLTSALLPPAATAAWLAGLVRASRVRRPG